MKPLSKECPVCKREIRGLSEENIKSNMDVHITFAHPDYKPKKEENHAKRHNQGNRPKTS